MLSLSRQVSVSATRVSSRYFTTAKLPRQQNFGQLVKLGSSGPVLQAGNGVPIINSCAGFRAYSTETKDVSAKVTQDSSDASATTSRSREPTKFEKKIFVGLGKYKTVDEVPDVVSEAALSSAKSKFRIYINICMGVATLVAAIGMVMIGKSRSKRGESLVKLGIERHPEAYGIAKK